MPNNSTPHVRKSAEPDPRVERSTSALSHALIELIQERDFGEITVQQILDRAGVGRTTFYAHYRNKEDVLHSSFEHLFAVLDRWVERPSPRGVRLFPITEFLEHIGDSRALADALRRSGQLEEFWTLCAGYATRLIERRLDLFGPAASRDARSLLARMLAGALMEALEWWHERPGAADAAQVDAAFHELARGVLLRSR